MKITKQLIKFFENEQREFGTEVAIHNLLWTLAADLYKDLGIDTIKTTAARGKKGTGKK